MTAISSDLTAVSLFAGIGGFDLALQRAGVRVAAAVEIDPACRGVLRRHFPQTAVFNDVTEVTGDQLRAAGFVPARGILCGGWPCQGNSVAGRRKGMADPRSGLWRHIVRLLAETRPRWFIGENVPGLLSINGGRDFGSVIRDLDELGYGVAWRVLDAQFFGVPQRRRRVFLAGCFGDPAGPVQVLLEPEGGEGNPEAREAAREGAAGAFGGSAVATLQGGGRRGHRIDAEGAAGGHLVPATAYALTSSQTRQDGTVETLIAHPVTSREAKRSADSDATNGLIVTPVALRGTRAGDSQIKAGEPGDPAFTVRTPGGGSSYPMIAHALTAEGADASEDGTGRGTPLVAVPLTAGTVAGEGVRPPGRRKEDDCNLAPMAFNPQTGGTKGRLGYGETAMALQASQVTAVAVGISENQRGEVLETAYSRQLTTGGGKPGQGYPAIRQETAVRRLTPMECERLQGFPDDWTRWLNDGTEQSDSARYRECGNAVAVPVAEWIARRVVAAEGASGAESAA